MMQALVPTQGRDGRPLLKARQVAAFLSCSVGTIRNNPVWRTLMLDYGQRMKRWDQADLDEIQAHVRRHGWSGALAKAEEIRASR